MANKAWKQARKEIEALGVGFYVLPAACCYGCIEESPVPEGEVPALYAMRRDFASTRGGYLYHQHITEELQGRIMVALSRVGIGYRWRNLGQALIITEMPA